MTDTPKKRGRGRPKKSEIAAKKPGGRVKRGRPPGEAAVMAEYKARMLASPKSEQVLHTVLTVANDPDHKNWSAAAKMVMDRLVPQSMFEDKLGGKSPSIEINLNFDDTPTSHSVRSRRGEDDEPVDVEFSSVPEQGGEDEG